MEKQQQQEDLVLLDVWASMYGMRVRIALAEKGLSYDYKEQDLSNKSQLLLDMNPIHKKVPVLIHNGRPICESGIIVQYIDEVWNDKSPLLPSDPYDRAHARFWTDFIDKKLYANGSKLYQKIGEENEVAGKELVGDLKLLEGALGDKPYFGGETFSYLDISLIPFYTWFHTFETYGKLNFEHECPKLIAWAKRCIQNKETVANTLPDPLKLFEFVQDIRRRFFGFKD